MKIRPGLNIQHPISKLIIDGVKTVETRTYSMPDKYIGIPLYIVETPGKLGAFKARVVGIATFGPSFKYNSKEEFYNDSSRHYVEPSSPYAWNKKQKWGWPIISFVKLKKPVLAPNGRGIRFTQNLKLS